MTAGRGCLLATIFWQPSSGGPQTGKQASPGAGVIDSRSVKTTEDGGVCGHDAGKKIAGRKRHVITDTPGRMLFIIVHSAAIQDGEGLPIS